MIGRHPFLALVLATGLTAQTADAGAATDEIDYFARDTYRIDPLVCPFHGRIDYEPGDIECGLLQVPENREDPQSRFIELHFVKLNSTWDDEAEEEDGEDEPGLAPGKRDDPVIYLTGGPGVKAETYVKRFIDHGIRKHRDLYILEQRGIGTSGDFCTNYFTRKPETFNVDSLEKQSEAQRIAATDCVMNAKAAGVDVTGYNTIENARDVRVLRRALGFEQWNVWGISYGSVLGQAYIKEDPAGIRAIVLDAIVPLNARDVPMSWRAIKWYVRDIEKLDELCQADAACAAAYPDLADRVRDTARAAMDDPITVEVKDIERYPSGEAYFLSDIAAFLPFLVFYEQSGYPGLPGLIYAWADAITERDEELFKALAVAPGDFFDGSQGMYDAIMCNDGHAQARVASTAADREEFPVLTNAFSFEGSAEALAEWCIDIGMPPRDAAEYSPVVTDIPTLLIEGDMDPITPPPLARSIEAGFSNATFVEFPFTGHGPSRSVECAGDMLNAFYDDPSAEPNLDCVDEMEAPEFFVPLYTTNAVPRLIVLAFEDKESLPWFAVWGGSGVLAVIVALIVLSIAPLGRRIDQRQAAPTDGARLTAWIAALSGTAALAIFGAAAAVTHQSAEILLLFGLAPWARLGGIAALLTGVLGVVTVALTVRARMRRRLPTGTLTGLALTGLGAVSLSAFLIYWDLAL